MSSPLLPGDPATVGGHRILARLGAGGMGVVYLGRSAVGALAAVKVVHRDLADEPGFRVRFQREIAAARRVDSPWVTPVLGAGPDESAPWLATAFVPGPSLGEAVQRFGPLPAHSVARLGRLVAEALEQVHTAGLVHRDVKPANVLLAVDGPRLIDFGIARPLGSTALTTAGAVAGSPGYLSPEQAVAGELGPESDVFSLGCLLGHALTGRPPFGHGTVEAILYRTVHGEPDLGETGAREMGPGETGPAGEADGRAAGRAGETAEAESGTTAPGSELAQRNALLAVVRDCLAKEPERRPDTAEVRRRLTPYAPEAAGPPGHRTAAPSGDAWLPGPVVQHIADTSARMLALPDIEATEPGTGDPTRGGTAGPGAPGAKEPPDARPDGPQLPGRRRALLTIGGAAALALGGGGLWALTRDDGDGAGGDTRWALGVHADLSGPGKHIGRALERGARLAVEQYNARGSRPFALALRTADDAGSTDRSKAAAERLTADRGVLAAIGPNTSASAESSLPAYDAATLPVLFVVPGSMSLRTERNSTAVHCRAPDFQVAFEIARHLALRANAAEVGLFLDRTAATYSWEIGNMTSRPLHDAKIGLHPRVVPAGLPDFRPQITGMVDAGIDSFIFAGYHDGAVRAAGDLTAAGFTGPRLGAQSLLDPRFLSEGGDDVEGWLVTASCIDPGAVPAAAGFRSAYRKRFGAEPGYYAAEAYDTANLTIRELTRAASGGRPPSRKRLVPLLRAAEYTGITKKFAFEHKTGRYKLEEGVSLYEVKDGRFRYRKPADPDQKSGSGSRPGSRASGTASRTASGAAS